MAHSSRPIMCPPTGHSPFVVTNPSRASSQNLRSDQTASVRSNCVGGRGLPDVTGYTASNIPWMKIKPHLHTMHVNTSLPTSCSNFTHGHRGDPLWCEWKVWMAVQLQILLGFRHQSVALKSHRPLLNPRLQAG